MVESVAGPRQRMVLFRSLELAIRHSRRMLFEPFDANKWLILGVIIFLDLWFQGRGGFNFNFGNWMSQEAKVGRRDLGELIRGTEQWVFERLGLVLGLGLAVLVLSLGLIAVITWLTSRGQMMFIRAVALNRADIGEHWREMREPANSLFRFRLALVLLSGAYMLALVVPAYFIFRSEVLQGPVQWFPLIMKLLPYVLLAVAGHLAFSLVHVLLRSFVSPLMFHFRIRCIEAWRFFGGILAGNLLIVVGFLAIRILYGMVFGILVTLVGCLTCCIGFLPVLHQALFSPYYVFDRAFPLYMLESLGPDFATVSVPIPEPDQEPPPLPGEALPPMP